MGLATATLWICELGYYAFTTVATDTVDDGVDSDCDGLNCSTVYSGDTRFAVCEGDYTWSGAETACLDAGHDGLAGILTSSDQAAIESIYDMTEEVFWFGFTDQDSEGTFTWTNGLSGSYTNWSSGQPNNGGGGQDYTYIVGPAHGSNAGSWADGSGSDRWGTICESR